MFGKRAARKAFKERVKASEPRMHIARLRVSPLSVSAAAARGDEGCVILMDQMRGFRVEAAELGVGLLPVSKVEGYGMPLACDFDGPPCFSCKECFLREVKMRSQGWTPEHGWP